MTKKPVIFSFWIIFTNMVKDHQILWDFQLYEINEPWMIETNVRLPVNLCHNFIFTKFTDKKSPRKDPRCTSQRSQFQYISKEAVQRSAAE